MADDKKIICPNCGESNPTAVIMCWACFTTLQSTAPRGIWKWLQPFGIRQVNSLHGGFPGQKYVREDQRDPVERILDTILLYAAKDGADSIRIEPVQIPVTREQLPSLDETLGPQRIGLSVYYHIEGEWRLQMKVPGIVLSPLVKAIKGRCNSTQRSESSVFAGVLPFKVEDRERTSHAKIESGPVGETITLTLN